MYIVPIETLSKGSLNQTKHSLHQSSAVSMPKYKCYNLDMFVSLTENPFKVVE